VALWPTAGAVARKDFTALRWLAALSLRERLGAAYHPVTTALHTHLAAKAFGRPAQFWEGILWAAYLLRNLPPFTELDQLPVWDAKLEPAAKLRHKLGEVTFGVDPKKLADWHSRNTRQKTAV
jgi:hypothetical protein